MQSNHISNHVKQQNIKQQSNPSPISNHIQKHPQFVSLNFLPLHFRCISGVGFTYHHHLYKSVDNWIATIIPLLQLFISILHLKYIYIHIYVLMIFQHSVQRLIISYWEWGNKISLSSFRMLFRIFIRLIIPEYYALQFFCCTIFDREFLFPNISSSHPSLLKKLFSFGFDIPYFLCLFFVFIGWLHSIDYSFFRVFLRIISSLLRYFPVLNVFI